MAASTTPAQRVQRWRSEYQDIKWDVVEGNAPRNAALNAGTENALDCLVGGDTAEAGVWIALSQLISFKYRRVAS